jgi:tryptophan synthase alpha chain
MDNRIDQKFAALKKAGQKAFVAYLTAGDPDLSRSADLILALDRAGADIVEVGVPFSDPLADGPVIQQSSQRALDSGTTLSGIFDMIRSVREKSQIPLVLFTYFNPVFKYGLEKFFADASVSGADGLLLLDVPPEEDVVLPNTRRLRRVGLVAPTTSPERAKKIAAQSSGFVYYVSREGVTGMQNSVAPEVAQKVDALKNVSPLPVCVGFGISTPEQAGGVAALADGVVIGSALVNHIAQHSAATDLLQRLENFARPLAAAIHKP